MSVLRRPRLAKAGVAALGGMALAAAALTPVGGAVAAPGDSADCPTAKPVSQLEHGEAVTARTVTQGTTPDALTGEVVGILDDGIAPGVDMVMVELAGSRVTDANGNVDAGIWAGMSGSPVYAQDGRLIGAVSYGLSFAPSEFAGVTPAARMYDVLSADGGSGGARSLDVPARVEDTLRSAGVARAGAERFRRLPLPTSVSGSLGQHRLARLAERAGVNRPLMAGGGRAQAGEATEPLVPGGNLTASLSYGDVTAAGIGTVTAVCGQQVLGFGHPMLWSGSSDLTMHGADAVFIQRDNVFGSFKVANPTAPIGAIVQDRLAAIAGVLGDLPATASVRSQMSSSEGSSRRGVTMVSHSADLPFLSAIHVLSNADVIYDGIRGGTGDMSWTMTVRRADGSTTRISRDDLVADRRDLTFGLIWGVYSDLERIVGNRFEDVTVTDVEVDAALDTDVLVGRIAKVEARRDGRWTVLTEHDRVRVRPGGRLPLRVHLRPTRESDAAPDSVRITASVPSKGTATRGHIHLGENESTGGDKVQSFDDLVASIQDQPSSNSVGGYFHFSNGRGGVREIAAAEATSAVRGDHLIKVRILR